MRNIIFASSFSLLIFVVLPLLIPNLVEATHLGNGLKDQCGDYVVSDDCERVRRVCKKMDGTIVACDTNECHYEEVSYRCDNESVSNSTFECIQRSPLDCGPGVTVCGPGADYACSNWCQRNWDDYLAGGGRNYQDSQCNLSINHRSYNCWMRDCLTNGCTNSSSSCIQSWNYTPGQTGSLSSSCSANACPGSSQVQCDSSHSCVFQPASSQPSCSVTLSSNTTSLTTGGQVVLSWTSQNVDSSRRGFGSLFLQGTQISSGSTPYPPLTLVNDTSSDIHKQFQVNFYNSSGQACASNAVNVTVRPLETCTQGCSCATDCSSCIQKASCGWNGSACVLGTRSGPGNTPDFLERSNFKFSKSGKTVKSS